jgi:hypothetical protein
MNKKYSYMGLAALTLFLWGAIYFVQVFVAEYEAERKQFYDECINFDYPEYHSNEFYCENKVEKYMNKKRGIK